MNKEFIGMLIEAGLDKTLANSVASIVNSEFKSRMKKVDEMVATSLKSDLQEIDGRLYEAIKSDLVKLLSSLDEQYENHLQTALDEQKQEHKEEFKSFLKGLDKVLSEKYGSQALTEEDEKTVYANKDDIEEDEIKDLTDDGTKVVTEEEDEEEAIEIPDVVIDAEDINVDGDVDVVADIASEDVDEIDELEVAKELLLKAQEEIETLRNELENGIDGEEGDAFDEFESFDEFEDYAEDAGFEGEDGDLGFLWERRDIITSKESLDAILKESTEKFKAKRKLRIKEKKAIKKSEQIKENKIKNIDTSDVAKNKKNVATLLEGNNFSNRNDDIYIPTKYL